MRKCQATTSVSLKVSIKLDNIWDSRDLESIMEEAERQAVSIIKAALSDQVIELEEKPVVTVVIVISPE